MWRTHFLLIIVMNSLATHLCRDGAPLPLRKRPPVTVGLPYVFAIFHTETWPFLPRSCVVFGYVVAIYILSDWRNLIMCHPSIFLVCSSSASLVHLSYTPLSAIVSRGIGVLDVAISISSRPCICFQRIQDITAAV